MIPPVRCHTCGKPIAIYHSAFKYLLQQKMTVALSKHAGGVLPEMMALSDELQPEMGEILNELNLTRSCCRQKILTAASFSEYY